MRVEVRLEQGAGLVLEDAVDEELDAGRCVAGSRRALAPLDQFADLLGAARVVPAQRADDARGQLPAARQRDVGDLFLGIDLGVLPVRDAEPMQLGLGKAKAGEHVVGRTRRQEPRDQGPRPFLERAVRPPIGVALDPAVGRIRHRGVDPGQLERPGVDPCRVAVAIVEIDRTIRYHPVEVGAVGDPPGKSVSDQPPPSTQGSSGCAVA